MTAKNGLYFSRPDLTQRPLVEYLEMFRTIEVAGKVWDMRVRDAIKRIMDNRDIYLRVEATTGVPWPFIGILHFRESSCNLDCQILNGEPWRRETEFEPKGYGPWPNWTVAAEFALSHTRLTALKSWGVAEMLHRFEAWNGWGYYQRKPTRHSPYLWSGCQHGRSLGLYVSDGNYVEFAMDAQPGAAVLLHYLMTQGIWKPYRRTNAPRPRIAYDPNGEYINGEVADFQRFLNGLLPLGYGNCALKVDGWAGPKTSEFTQMVFGFRLDGDVAP